MSYIGTREFLLGSAYVLGTLGTLFATYKSGMKQPRLRVWKIETSTKKTKYVTYIRYASSGTGCSVHQETFYKLGCKIDNDDELYRIFDVMEGVADKIDTELDIERLMELTVESFTGTGIYAKIEIEEDLC